MKRAACMLVVRKGSNHDNDPRRFLGIRTHKNPQGWSLPGGKCDEGESFVDAAIRELREETGLVVQAVLRVPLLAAPCAGNPEFLVKTFVPLMWEGKPTSSTEGEVQWVTREDLLAGPYAEYNRKLFEAYDEAVSKVKRAMKS